MYKFQLTITFIVLASLSTITKLTLPLIGINSDIISYQIVADIVSQGRTIYDNTARYNYGPVWGYTLGVIGHLVKLIWKSNVYVPAFHFIISGILSLVDLGIAIMLWKLFGKIPAYVFLINPLSIIISGSHGQFDNLAIFLALISWYLILKNKFSGYLILGLSLATKHIFIFFTAWLLIEALVKNDPKLLKKKITGIFISLSVFFFGFALEIVRNLDAISDIISGISKNVFLYRGYGIGLGKIVTDILVPQRIINFSQQVPLISGYMFFYVLGVILLGWTVIKTGIKKLYYLPLYLLVFYGLGISEARQYAAIPLVGLAVFYDKIPALVSFVFGFIYATTTNYRNTIINDRIDIFILIGDKLIPNIPYISGLDISQPSFQSWTLLLLISILFFGYRKTRHNYISTKTSAFFAGFCVAAFLLIINSLCFHFAKTAPVSEIKLIDAPTSVTVICQRPLISYAYRLENKDNLDKFKNCDYDLPPF